MKDDQRIERRLMARFGEGLKRRLLAALARFDLGSLPIPIRRGARPGDRLPILAGAAGMALAAALGSRDGTR